jgi:hypothetical protein
VLVPVLRDLLDRRVRTVNDAHKLVGIAPAGWQVERADTASHVFGDEQLRRMAAALIRSRDARGQRVFGFTGCKPGAGTTSLVLELAGSLRTLGYKVLAVEANGYSRDARFASGRPGMAELLGGRAGSPHKERLDFGQGGRLGNLDAHDQGALAFPAPDGQQQVPHRLDRQQRPAPVVRIGLASRRQPDELGQARTTACSIFYVWWVAASILQAAGRVSSKYSALRLWPRLRLLEFLSFPK